MSYAKHECYKCGKILSVPELIRVTDRVKTGVSDYQRRVTSGNLRPGGRSTHYSLKQRWICPACLKKRRIGQLLIVGIVATIAVPWLAVALGALVLIVVLFRSSKRLVLAIFCVVGGLLAVGAYYGKGKDRGYLHNRSSQPSLAPSLSSDVLSEKQPSLVSSALTTVKSLSTSTETKSGDVGNPAANEAMPKLNRKENQVAAAATITAEPASVNEVQAAIREALATGKPTRWHAEKLHGYAVPSEPGIDGCRMIQVSVNETGDKATPVKMCP